jgi:two-component sensor histidine kinase
MCKTLKLSMIDDRQPIPLRCASKAAPSLPVKPSATTRSLVTGAMAYELTGANWKLTGSDNGIGQPAGHFDKTNPGLGTTIIEALAKQLNACVEALMNPLGTTVSVAHPAFASQPLTAAS